MFSLFCLEYDLVAVREDILSRVVFRRDIGDRVHFTVFEKVICDTEFSPDIALWDISLDPGET